MYVKKILCAVCILYLLCCNYYLAKAQNTSNKGKDFWLGYGNHVNGYMGGGQRMALYITSDVNTQGKVEIPSINYSAAFTVTPNGITTVDIPQNAYIPGGSGATAPYGGNGNGKYDLGIHVSSEKDIVVYAHIYNANVSGATLVLPTPTLGKDYISINYTQVSNMPNSFSYFFVVAVEDNTEVEIIPSADTQGSNDGKPGWAAGTTHFITLKKGEIYQVLGKQLNTNSAPGTAIGNDLTGSRIRSVSTNAEACKRIAVFSGSGKIAIGSCITPFSGAGSSDNLYQQVYPTAAWGRKFVTVPLKSRNYDVFRIVKSDPSAVVTLNGVQIPQNSFTGGVYYDFDSHTPNAIDSDKPIQVVQYAVTQNRAMNCTTINEPYGDPEMIYLNPVEQTLTHITMYSSSKYDIRAHYVNVVMLKKDVQSFKLDNVSHAADFTSFSASPDYAIAQISVSSGTHTLSADAGFNAIAYGFGSAESYGYAAGANLKSLGIEVEGKGPAVNQIVSNGCVNQPLNLKVTLGYNTVTKLSWDPGNGLPLIDVLNPVADSTFQANGKNYYVYRLKQDIVYTIAKDYSIQVTAQNSSGECGSTEILQLDFSIYDPPVPKFQAPGEICSDEQVQFTDQSDGKGHAVTSWKWDFGDSTFSTLQNPKHTYSSPGKYTVTLTVTNATSCSPVGLSQTITVLSLPVAGFSQQTVSCSPPTVRFTSTSTAADGIITKWIWDFGDETGEERTGSAAFDHTFPASGTYTVRLTVQTDKGCVSNVLSRTINVSPSPLVDFVLPEVCLTDAFAQFTDKSSISDGSETVFTYLWDFGDQTTSALKNPRHKYSAQGVYNVSLTVTSDHGCTSTLTRQFTVNGAVPKADFTVQNINNLCSNQQVSFINKSTVDFGSITKLVWIFDPSDPGSKFTDDNPSPSKAYAHLYPASPVNRNYTVTMQAYSGGSCVDEKSQTIILQAVPGVVFTQLNPVCAEQSSFQITQAAEINGLAGSGSFSGPGVSPSGMFSPAKAGAGTHTITYTFTAANGCSDSATQQITVYPMPVVNAGRDTIILEGGQSKLHATATGNNLSYKWTPSAGLDRDDIPNPVATPTEDITYTLTVISGQGCSATDAIFVKVLKSPEIPNTFTPNGDGINDTWDIKYLSSYPGCTVNIFNRYGVKVYSSAGYSEAWDGKNNGNDLPQGTYFYIVDPKNGRKVFSGSVTILK